MLRPMSSGLVQYQVGALVVVTIDPSTATLDAANDIVRLRVERPSGAKSSWEPTTISGQTVTFRTRARSDLSEPGLYLIQALIRKGAHDPEIPTRVGSFVVDPLI